MVVATRSSNQHILLTEVLPSAAAKQDNLRLKVLMRIVSSFLGDDGGQNLLNCESALYFLNL